MPYSRNSRILASGAVFALTVASALAATDETAVRVDFASELGPLPQVFEAGMTAYKMSSYPDYMKRQFYDDMDVGLIYLELTHKVLITSGSLAQIDELCGQLDKDVLGIIAAGGRVEFNAAGMPRWLASLDIEVPMSNVDASAVWTRCPPRDYDLWRQALAAVAGHFRRLLAENGIKEEKGTLKYSVWGEPDIFYWQGTEEAFFKTYQYAVEGFLAGDPLAEVGGIDVSSIDAAKHEPVQYASSRPGPMMEHWLEYCRDNGVRVDYVTWHRFGACPFPKGQDDYAAQAGVVRQWLDKYGFAETSIQLADWTSWERRDVPQHSWLSSDEDDEYSAAWAAAVLHALDRAGYTRQRHGLLFEQIPEKFQDEFGGDWGIMTKNGIVKARYNVFKAFGMMKGNRVQAEAADEFTNVLATSADDAAYVLVSRFVPEDAMILKSLGLRLTLAAYEAGLSRDDLRDPAKLGLPGQDIDAWIAILSGRQELDAQLVPEFARRVIESVATLYQSAQKQRPNAVESNIELTGLRPGRTYGVQRYLIDKTHSNAWHVHKKINQDVIRVWAEAGRICKRGELLRQKGFSEDEIAEVPAVDKVNPYATKQVLPQELAPRARDLLEVLLKQQVGMAKGIAQINSSKEVSLDCVEQQNLYASGDGTLRLAASFEPCSVSLWVLRDVQADNQQVQPLQGKEVK